ncbi:hypothetical protein PAECIP112173_02991 [Paenibacillus sp. JJ-100]|uniref:hypothetical protein n=1 Tax=Paenibacillus sp. JJ-100 TaxID=2974896 RepID=UPI0022FFC1F2|nr:hypothetical protein [Paenibacillus sp. JJ-100]CAI6080752.1 hypothetical protein PAECIP112173_02991 [Paenibacillus sp. JJ-100]
MRVKIWVIASCLFLVAIVFTSCSSKEKMKTVEFAGIVMNLPQDWMINESHTNEIELHYWIGKDVKFDGFFHIRAVPKDFYRSRGSRFFNMDNGTYKFFYELREKDQLADNILWMSFDAKADGWGDVPRPTNVINMIIVETPDKVHEITFDMSNSYSEKNQDLLDRIFKSIKILK